VRAYLIEADPAITDLLVEACASVDVTLTVAGGPAAQAMLERVGAGDLLIIDATMAHGLEPAGLVRLVAPSRARVLLIYDAPATLEQAQRAAARPLTALRYPFPWLELLSMLRMCAIHSQAPHVDLGRCLASDQQYQMLQLVAAGYSHARIGTTLGVTDGSVKRQLARLKAKFAVTTPEELCLIYRFCSAVRPFCWVTGLPCPRGQISAHI
jgi:DNA-binding CsgD family transcriptional regulator